MVVCSAARDEAGARGQGAIPFVLSGANVMCPGLTSAGGDMPGAFEAGTPVVRWCSET